MSGRARAAHAGQVNEAVVRLRQVEEAPVALLAREHGVRLHRDGLAVRSANAALVCALEVLNGFVGVALVEGLDLVVFAVECFERIARGELLDFGGKAREPSESL